MRVVPVSLTALSALLAIALVVLPTPPAPAQADGDIQYRVEIDRDSNGAPAAFAAVHDGTLSVTVRFKIKHAADDRLATNVSKDEIVVTEDGVPVKNLTIYSPRGADKLTAVLAMDTSGSMHEQNKITEARRAATLFLDHLNDKADCGLILFNHEILQPTLPPIRDPERFVEYREVLRRRIAAAQPAGGTAYLDATADAVGMLKGVKGRRAVVLMTDGVDLNSKLTLPQVIEEAQATEVPVYTLGVGEPGKKEPVTSVLVLDCSGSMIRPADDVDRTPKIEALRRAAKRFVEIMRPGARTTLLPFASSVSTPKPFSDDKQRLKDEIDKLKARDGTLLYDATFAGIETLEAAHPEGKRAVVVLTDGVDESPGSRRRVEDVIERARETNTPLYMLGLGRPGEIDEQVMRRMAEAVPGGSFHHVHNEKELVDIFEQLSIDLHDEGIDEVSLRALADQTGGKYLPARDVSKLSLIYTELAEELQSTYTVTFPSRRSSHDGTARGIDIRVVRGGRTISDVASADYNVRGVVVPEMDYRIYLGMLAALGVLLVVPSGVRALYRFYGGV